jgi:hypothetical protein
VIFARPQERAADATSAGIAAAPAQTKPRAQEKMRVTVSGNLASTPRYAPLPKKGCESVSSSPNISKTGRPASTASMPPAITPVGSRPGTPSGVIRSPLRANVSQRNQRFVKGARSEVEELYRYGQRPAVRPERTQPDRE